MRHENLWVMCAAASTALVIMVGAAGAASAQPPREATVVGQRSEDGLSVRVGYRDLNLASAQGERTLNRRVRGAAEFVCEPHYDAMARSNCQAYAWNGARPQIALAVRRAKQIAQLGSSSIPLVAIAIAGR